MGGELKNATAALRLMQSKARLAICTSAAADELEHSGKMYPEAE